MDKETFRCVFCGWEVTGFAGPVEPATIDAAPTDPPPGSGFFRLQGPSHGTMFTDMPIYVCSKEHGIEVFKGTPPTAPPIHEEVIKGWKPVKRATPAPRGPGR